MILQNIRGSYCRILTWEVLRIKEQEKRLTLQEHDDDDDINTVWAERTAVEC